MQSEKQKMDEKRVTCSQKMRILRQKKIEPHKQTQKESAAEREQRVTAYTI